MLGGGNEFIGLKFSLLSDRRHKERQNSFSCSV